VVFVYCLYGDVVCEDELVVVFVVGEGCEVE